MLKTKKEKLYAVLIALFAVAILCVVITGLTGKPAPAAAAAPASGKVEIRGMDKIVEVEKLVQVEKTITGEMLQDGLRDMGTLITQEYYFTEVMTYSSVLKDPLFHLEIKPTESSFVVSYDGVVTAGMDFSGIRVEKDEGAKVINVALPKAAIQNVDIDPESFEKYTEKAGMFNPVSVEDFNASLVELEATARAKAIDRGVLTRADQNGRQVVDQFIRSLVDVSEYTLTYKTV